MSHIQAIISLLCRPFACSITWTPLGHAIVTLCVGLNFVEKLSSGVMPRVRALASSVLISALSSRHPEAHRHVSRPLSPSLLKSTPPFACSFGFSHLSTRVVYVFSLLRRCMTDARVQTFSLPWVNPCPVEFQSTSVTPCDQTFSLPRVNPCPAKFQSLASHHVSRALIALSQIFSLESCSPLMPFSHFRYAIDHPLYLVWL